MVGPRTTPVIAGLTVALVSIMVGAVLLPYLIREVHAQGFAAPPGFGIPLLLVMITVAALAAILALIIWLIKVHKTRVILGIAAIFSAFLTIAAATPVDMRSFYAGSTISYCEDNPCGEGIKILDIQNYDELHQSYPSTLRKAIDGARVEGEGSCCSVTRISYFEELSLLPLLSSSTINIGNRFSNDNPYLFNFRGEYYTISFHHVDVDSRNVYPDTTFVLHAIFLIIMVSIIFFSVALPRGIATDIGIPVKGGRSMEQQGTPQNQRRLLQRRTIAVQWIAMRRYDVPFVGIALYAILFTSSILLGYSSYHSSSQIIVTGAILILLLYMIIILVGRVSIRRRI